ncbi:hypothetical protein EGCR1_04165 [Enterococcus gilvus]|uniref:hypothetical protein n=1 Tax=Enterococcus gilvus TaxID=160453 RepID=UPI000DF5D299|nr:hypothetical protein [Enterococcus gilvus]AXG37942.1 hypothetical protein EGCR1_04165 [Enterococcus gilvus]HDL2312222.1 hypothetical protein [Enterococcus faecium]
MKKILLSTVVAASMLSVLIGVPDVSEAAVNQNIGEVSPRIKVAEVPYLQFIREKYVGGRWVNWTSETLSTTTIRYQTSFTAVKNPYDEEVWYNQDGTPSTRSYYVRYAYILN